MNKRKPQAPKTFQPDPFIDLTSGCAAAGMKPKTARRWWESTPPKFPKPILIEGKLYFRESWIKNWMDDIDNTTDVAILTKAPVSLHSSQADVISYFKRNIGRYISIYEFRKNGISNPDQLISELIMLGAIIKKNTAPAIDESGKEHKKVNWYLFSGWGS